jgi:predicted DNA-binding transcriptional regulator YafY
MDIKARLRPFYVAKMLYEQTDEDHYLTIAQIIDQLETDYGISTTRGTVGDDIRVLQEFGFEIEVEQSTQKRIYLIGRTFDLPELKTLIDAIESARFIPKKKSADLVKKIASLSSKHTSEDLVRNVDVENRLKTDNQKVLYIMDALNEAINKKKKVSFQYFSYNANKKQEIKNGGFTYIFSPYKLIWNGDYYYAVGFSEKHKSVGSFRVDRIVKQPKVLEEPAISPPDGFDLNVFLNSMFRMYNGERKQVELICDNDLMDAIIDKFGKNVLVSPNDSESFRVTTNTAVGRVFYSWVFGFEGKVSILSPDEVREEYAKMVRNAADILEQKRAKG